MVKVCLGAEHLCDRDSVNMKAVPNVFTAWERNKDQGWQPRGSSPTLFQSLQIYSGISPCHQHLSPTLVASTCH
eukprot:scaffold1878_cov258-Pinguiococcus_pyrenoidosus.AAC.27